MKKNSKEVSKGFSWKGWVTPVNSADSQMISIPIGKETPKGWKCEEKQDCGVSMYHTHVVR